MDLLAATSQVPSGLIAVLALAVVMVVLIARSVQVVPQAQVVIVERMGRYQSTLSTGLHILVPFIDVVRVTIDMREQATELGPIEVTTSDGVLLHVPVRLTYEITDPVRATYQVHSLVDATAQLAAAALRNTIAARTAVQARDESALIEAEVFAVLDEVVASWGMRIARLEVLDTANTSAAGLTAQAASLEAQLADVRARLERAD